MHQKIDMLGFVFNWGRPSEETCGPGLRDQYTAEFYYQLHLLSHLTITADIQLVVNPALNPDEDQIWIFGLCPDGFLIQKDLIFYDFRRKEIGSYTETLRNMKSTTL